MDRPNNLPNTTAGPVFAYAKSELITKVQLLFQRLKHMQVKHLPLLGKTWC